MHTEENMGLRREAVGDVPWLEGGAVGRRDRVADCKRRASEVDHAVVSIWGAVWRR